MSRWFKGAVGVLILASLLLQLTGASATPDATQPTVRVSHTINVLDWGMLVVNDTVTITNTDSASVSSFLIGVPERVGRHLSYAFARAGENETLGLEMNADLGRSGFRAVKVSFSPIPSGATYRFTVTLIFSGLITPSSAGYNVTAPIYPSLSQEAERVDVKVVLPAAVTLVSSYWSEGGNPVLEYAQTPLEAYADTVSSKLSFKGSFRLVDCESARREVLLDPLGEITVSDSYRLRNLGGDTFNSIDFSLPMGAHNVTARDDLGEVKVTSREGRDAVANVTVSLRYSIRGSPHYDAYSFTLKYKLPWRLYVSRLDALVSSQMSLTLIPYSKWVIRSLDFVATLPEGAQYEKASPPPDRVEKAGLSPVISYRVLNATPYHRLTLKLKYRYLIFWSALRPTLWMGLGVAIVCSLIGLSRLRKPPQPLAGIPVDVLSSYVEVVDRRAALRQEMESLDEDLSRDRIRRHDYRRRTRQISQEMQSLDRELEELKPKVRAISSRYAAIVRGVEIAESEYDTARSSVLRLETTYREGKVSKDAYERLRMDLYKRMNRAKSLIDGTTISLREEIR